jgi:hypothetical protein
MVTSGTIATTTVTAQSLIDHAARRCNKLAQELGAEQQMALKENLFMILSALGNRGVSLWTITKTVMGFIPEQGLYTMPNGTIEVINVMYRLPLTSFGTPISSAGTPANAFDQNTSTFCDAGINGYIGWDYGSGNSVYVTSVGFMPHGTLTLSLVIEWSADTVTWNTLYTPTAATTYADGSWTFWDIEPGVQQRAYRIRETAGGDLAAREVLPENGENEIKMARLNIDDYTNLPSKHQQINTPPQYWVNKLLNSLQIQVWGIPGNTFYQLVVWYHRYIQDVGALSNQIEVPNRWLKAIRDLLAYDASLELKDVDPQRVQLLQAVSQQSLMEAEAEERDHSPIYWAPNISVYTR